MTVATLRPGGIPKIEIAGTISYNLLEPVPVRFTTTASPFADAIWKSLCAYCAEHCVAYRIGYFMDGKLVESRAEREYLVGGGGWEN